MISVCIATYNGGKFIEEQLKSILLQLGEEDELVISDDSSDDDTVSIIQRFNDRRIKLITGRKFRSPVSNFGYAINQAKGDFIFLSDQDDIWLDNKIAITIDHFNHGYDVVLSDCKVVDEQLNVIHESFFTLNNSGKGLVKNLVKNSYIGCCLAFKRDFLKIIQPFPARIPMHDLWIGFAGELIGKVAFIYTPLILYRRHGKNESPTGNKSPYSLRQKVAFRLNTIRYIPLLFYRYLRS